MIGKVTVVMLLFTNAHKGPFYPCFLKCFNVELSDFQFFQEILLPGSHNKSLYTISFFIIFSG